MGGCYTMARGACSQETARLICKVGAEAHMRHAELRMSRKPWCMHLHGQCLKLLVVSSSRGTVLRLVATCPHSSCATAGRSHCAWRRGTRPARRWGRMARGASHGFDSCLVLHSCAVPRYGAGTRVAAG